MLPIKKLILSLSVLLVVFQSNAQTFLNGSFEVTTATMVCNYNLSNPTFNGLMSNTVAFGAANETDILVAGCYTPTIPDGVRAVGIAGTFDEISLELSSPLTIGESYTISFWTRSDINFRPRGDVEIGASTSSVAFGTPIYTAVTVESTWINHVFTFVAPNAATYITARNVAGPIYWNHLDNFVMVEPEDELEVVPTHSSCFGACDGSATVIEGVLGPYTYLWDPTAGGGTTGTATDLCAGTYSVEVTNVSGGVEVLEVTIEEPTEITGGIVDQINVSCFGGTDGEVTVEATGGTGALTYDIGGGPVDPGVFTGLGSGAYVVTVLDENGCSLDVPVDITEPAELILNEVAVNDVICNGGDDGSIEVVGSGGTGPYAYSIDDVVYDPGAIFGGLTAGIYTLYVQDDNGCSATLDLTVTEPEPIVVDATATGEICEGDCMGTIWLDPSGGVGTYSYSIDDCITTDVDGAFSDLCAGDYLICVEDENGCRYNDVLTVDAGAPPVDATIFPISGPLCVDADPVTITAIDMGVLSGPGVVGDTFDPALAGPGTHTITNTITAGCGGVSTLDIVVNPLPSVSFMSTINSGCAPVEVTFNNTGDSGTACEWNFGDGAFSTLCGDVTHTYSNAGVYDVSLTVTDMNGCTATTAYYGYVDVYALPVADFDFSPSVTTTLDTEIDFTDRSTGASNWNWTFDDFGNSSDENPTFVFPTQQGTYEITLLVTTTNGCQDAITKVLTIYEEQLIYVPNTITPDGDPYNQVFLPYFTGIDVYDFHMTLYNRWGEIIFESYDVTKGWNGTYGGEIVPAGVYVWHITTADIATDKKLEYYGHVTVLR